MHRSYKTLIPWSLCGLIFFSCQQVQAAPAQNNQTQASHLCQHTKTLPAYVTRDQIRIKAHLSRVIRLLKSKDTSKLPAHLQVERKRNIERLIKYRREGVFPRNSGHVGLTPYFIDNDGRACAVGHLMIASGYRSVAEQVARRENNAYVADIKTPDAHRWIAQSGLSAAECALIQPSYGGCEGQPADPVCDTEGRTHRNPCWARWNGATVAYKGQCKAEGAQSEPVQDAGTPDQNSAFPAPDTTPTPTPDTQTNKPDLNPPSTGLQCSTKGGTAPVFGLAMLVLAFGMSLRRKQS